MSDYERSVSEVDAWDHVYALDPIERHATFAIVMANIGTRSVVKSRRLAIPVGIEKQGPHVDAASTTLIELARKKIN